MCPHVGAWRTHRSMVPLLYRSNQSGGYTGAIAGLGFGPSPDGKKALAIYPDHDVKAQFDTLMTPVDVEMVSSLLVA